MTDHANVVRDALYAADGERSVAASIIHRGLAALDALVADNTRLTAERDALAESYIDVCRDRANMEARADAAEAERDEARASNEVFMSGEAYSRMHDAWHAETDRAEAAEADAKRKTEALTAILGHDAELNPVWQLGAGQNYRRWQDAKNAARAALADTANRPNQGEAE